MRGEARRVGERELTPIAFRLAAQWHAPGWVAAGGYAWCYPLAVSVKEGTATSVRLIPDVVRLASLGSALLVASLAAGRVRSRRGEKR